MDGWEGYAVEKAGLAYEKLIGNKTLYTTRAEALRETQSDLSAVDEDDAPESCRADLELVQEATEPDGLVTAAVARLYVASHETGATALLPTFRVVPTSVPTDAWRI